MTPLAPSATQDRVPVSLRDLCLYFLWLGALGFGGPKRLSVTLVVAATISAAELPFDHEVGLVILYVLLASLLVWLPVVLFIVFGNRATDWMNRAQEWVYAHEQPLTFYPTLVLGIVLVVESLTYLL